MTDQTHPQLTPPSEVLALAARLEDAGFETWCVGGAVRDALLGRPDLDWDLATRATPAEMRRVFRRTVPIGVEHGTLGVLDEIGRMHEVTTFRRDVETDGRHAKVVFSDSIDEDLARRDLTINAIAWSPAKRVLHDPFGGRADLENRLVRAVGDPAERMREDRLRALRAIRFAGRFEFEIEPETWRAIVASAPHLTRLSAERVREELEKTMDQVARPSRAIRLWKESGALAALIPALASISPLQLQGLDYLPMPGLPSRPQRRINRLALLFFGLDGRGAEASLRALRFSNRDVAWIGALADRWHRLGAEIEHTLTAHEPPPEAGVRRLVSAIGRTRAAPLLRVAAALWAAKYEVGLMPSLSRRIGNLYRRVLRIAYHDAIEIGDLAIDGDDLRTAGVAPGPEVGKILQRLLDRVLDDPSLNSRERLLALVREAREAREQDTPASGAQ